MDSKKKTKNNKKESEDQRTKVNLFGRWFKSDYDKKNWALKILDLLLMTILTFVIMFIAQWNKAKTKQQKMKFIGVIVLVLVILFHYRVEDVFIYYYGTFTKGIVTSEIRGLHGTTFYYSFEVNSKTYWGDSYIPGYDKARINDTIEIVYLPIFPDICRSIEGYYHGNFRNHHVKLKSKEYY